MNYLNTEQHKKHQKDSTPNSVCDLVSFHTHPYTQVWWKAILCAFLLNFVLINRPKENSCLSTQAKLPHYISTALLFNGLVNNLCHIVNSKIKKMELLSFPKETKYMYSIHWLISEIWLENFKIFFWGGGGKLNCLSINKEQNKLTYRIICIYTTSG